MTRWRKKQPSPFETEEGRRVVVTVDGEVGFVGLHFGSGDSGIGRIRINGGEEAAAGEVEGVLEGFRVRVLKAPSMKNKAFSPDEDARGFIKGNRQWLNARVQNQRRHPNQSLDRQRKWFLPFRQGG